MIFTFPEAAEKTGAAGGVNPVKVIILLGGVVLGDAQVAVDVIITEI